MAPSGSSPWPDFQMFQQLPMPQRLWVPCKLVLPAAPAWRRPGEDVAAGEPLLECVGSEDPMPLAPVDGQVVGSGWVTLTGGTRCPAIELEPRRTSGSSADAARVSAPTAQAKASFDRGQIAEFLDLLRNSGVWADRWSSPDLLGQLRQCRKSPPDTIVCNVLDADRSTGVNRATAVGDGESVAAGISALAGVVGAARTWIAVDDAEPYSSWRVLREALGPARSGIRFVPIENHYPQVDPALLAITLLRRRLKPGELPTQKGMLMVDAAAAAAIGRLLNRGTLPLWTPIAVYDQPRDRTSFFSAPIGASVGDVLDALDLPRRGLDLRAGGPLRELHVDSRTVISAGDELGIFATRRQPDINPEPCIRCGWCVEGCPTRIHPAGLLEAAQQEDDLLADQYGLESCIECGVCSYVCPSHLPLLHAIRGIKAVRRQSEELP